MKKTNEAKGFLTGFTLAPILLRIFSLFLFTGLVQSKVAAQNYTYTTEGFEQTGIWPTSNSGTQVTVVSSTGSWKVQNASRVTTSFAPGGTASLTTNSSGLLISPFLANGAGILTWKSSSSSSTGRPYSVSTSTDGVTFTTFATGTGFGTTSAWSIISIPINNPSIRYVRLQTAGGGSSFYDDVNITPAVPVTPTVTTTTASGISFFAATSGGNVVFDGNAAVTARGIVWSTSPNPTIILNNGITTDGTGTGNFVSSITGLSPSTTYYYRAYATNSVGTAYGTEYSFTTPAPTPTLTVTPNSLAFGNQQVAAASAPKTYTLTGAFLSPAAGSITITAPAGYSVSLTSSGGYGGSISLPYSGGTISATTIYVRFSPPALGTFAGSITNGGGGAPGVNVSVSGVGSVALPDFTNVGFDFWTGFGYEEKMSQKAGNSGEAKLSLYISVPSGSVAAQVVVDLPGIPGAVGFPKTVTVTPGTVTEIQGFPTGDPNNANNPTGMPDTRLYYTGASNRGIHIYSTNGVPVSAWMHSYTTGNSAAGAMLFPTNTWSSSYSVQAYGGYSNNSNPNSFFFIIAKEDNTPIWFTPSHDIQDSSVNTLFNDNTTSYVKYSAGVEYGPFILNKGQIFNAMGVIQGSGSGIGAGKAFGLDLTGSKVRTTCDKQIAVFGGNGRCLINAATCSATSGSDHMIQQMFPDVAWGKKYLTSPTTTMEYNLYRINVTDPTTQVWVNNPTHTTPLTGLINNLYYEIASSQPQLIESDKPITVTQFIVAAGCANQNGSKGNGDPEMIILSPVEQGINNTAVYSATIKNPAASYNGHYINVIIKTSGVASFRLDGGTTGDPGINQTTASSTTCYNTGGNLPLATIFKPHPQDASYSYANLRVQPGMAHTLTSDSTFNAIAYGMGDGESYGYNAGTKVKDLSQFLLINNPYGQTAGLTCKGNPFYFRIALPYAPAQLTSLTWDFDTNPEMTPNATVVQNNPTPDSTFVVDGTTYYVYKIATAYQFATAGTYPFKVMANAVTAGGCSGTKIFNKNITVTDGPLAKFQFVLGSCGNTTVQFTDASTSDSSAVVAWNWNFGDLSTLADTSHIKNTSYTYPSLSAFTASLRAINAAGCYSDTTVVIDLSGVLHAKLNAYPKDSICAGETLTFGDLSTSGGTYGTITSWKWNFGDGTALLTATTGASVTHTFTTAGTYYVTLQVITSSGCISNIDSIKIFVGQVPAINSATSGTICSGNAVNYTITSSVAGTTFTWSRAAVGGITNAAVAGQTSATITEALINTTNAPVTVNYIITPLAGKCPGNPFTYTVTVNPTATITSAASATLCSGASQNYNITGSVTGSTYLWSRAAVAGISNAAVTGQTSSSITEALINTTNAPLNVTYVITPSANGCPGTSFNYVVTVNPTPAINSASSITICSGTALNYMITSAVSGANYTWTRPAITGISNPAVSGQTTNPITETLVNTTNVSQVVIYNISSAANGCAAPVFTYSVTVNPTTSITSASASNICSGSALNYTITSSVAGTTYSWSRAATGGISNPAVNGQTSNTITETLVNTTTTPVTVNYVITPSANGCAGLSFNYSVTVNPTPSITSSSTGGLCSGHALNYIITSNVAGATYSWSRPAVTGISNAAVSGQTSSSITETLVNTSTTTLSVTYTIVASFNGCTASPFTYTVLVTPAPTITSAATASICNSVAQNYTITSSVSGSTYLWSRAAVAGISNAAVTGQTSSSITEALINTTNAPLNVTYVITPSANGCPGTSFNYVVTVNPTAVITSAASAIVCSGTAQNYSITSNVSGTGFTWSRAVVSGISNASVSGQTSSSITEALINTTTTAVNVTYVITPTVNGCQGTPFNYVVTVNPATGITSVTTGSVCSGNLNTYLITSTVSGTTYNWSRAAVTGITNPAVSGQTSNPIKETLVNNTNTQVDAVYIITASANGCSAAPFTYTLTVNPTATITSGPTGEVCSSSAQNYQITSNVNGITANWSRASVAGISNTAVTGLGTSITETLLNTTTADVNVTYLITPTFSGCAGTPFSYVVTVHPKPQVDFTFSQISECVTDSVSFFSTASSFVTNYSWDFGNPPGDNNPNPLKKFSRGGSYNVVLVVTTAANCTATAQHTVVLAPTLAVPAITALPTTNSVIFQWQPIPGANRYEISVDGGLTFTAPNGANGLSDTVGGLVPLEPASIIVRAIGDFVCQQSEASLTSAAVLPDLDLFIPNTITPNGDGKNDKLKVLGNYIQFIEMQVYNQWGQLIYTYRGNDPNAGWDGTVNGAPQPSGVYAYTVTVTMKNRKVNKKGLFNIIR